MIIDPLAEDYYSLSSYGYFAGNPVASMPEDDNTVKQDKTRVVK